MDKFLKITRLIGIAILIAFLIFINITMIQNIVENGWDWYDLIFILLIPSTLSAIFAAVSIIKNWKEYWKS